MNLCFGCCPRGSKLELARSIYKISIFLRRSLEGLLLLLQRLNLSHQVLQLLQHGLLLLQLVLSHIRIGFRRLLLLGRLLLWLLRLVLL